LGLSNYHAVKTHGGTEVTFHTDLLSILDGMIGLLQPRPLYRMAKNPGTSYTECWVHPEAMPRTLDAGCTQTPVSRAIDAGCTHKQMPRTWTLGATRSQCTNTGGWVHPEAGASYTGPWVHPDAGASYNGRWVHPYAGASYTAGWVTQTWRLGGPTVAMDVAKKKTLCCPYVQPFTQQPRLSHTLRCM
jgi:hypothetical protein